jgi:hypothetical protein
MTQTYNKRSTGDISRLMVAGSPMAIKVHELSANTTNRLGGYFDVCHHTDRLKDFLRNHTYFFYNADTGMPAKGFNQDGEYCIEDSKIAPNKKYAIKKNLTIVESGIFADKYYLIVNMFDQTGKQTTGENLI